MVIGAPRCALALTRDGEDDVLTRRDRCYRTSLAYERGTQLWRGRRDWRMASDDLGVGVGVGLGVGVVVVVGVWTGLDWVGSVPTSADSPRAAT